KRSTRPFCQGERKDVGRSRIPIARTRALNTAPKARSLSRMRYFGAMSQGNVSVIWRANHSAVGLRVTANHSNCRRLWPRTRNAKRDRKSTRLNSSHVAISYAVFCLKKKNKKKQEEQTN